MSHSQKEDIRGQLSDIQKKLFGSARDKSTTPLPLPDPTHGARQPPGGNDSGPKLKLRTSSSHLGKLSNSNKMNKLIPQPAPALGPENKGHDMDFVVGLSENLLTECRKLTAENNKYKSKLKSAAEELEKYKSQIVALTNSRSFAENTEEQLKSKNWELETKNTTLIEDLDQLRAANDKLVKTNNEMTLRIASIQKEHDDLRISHNTLDTDFHKTKDTYEKEVAELNARIDSLNDENDSLHIQLTAAKTAEENIHDTAATKKPQPSFARMQAVEEDDPTDLGSILEASERILRDANADSVSSDLRVETLKANLDHSYKMVAKLRGALLKARFENHSSAKGTPPSSKKAKRKEFLPPLTRTSTSFSPAKRNSKFVVLDDENENWPLDEKWEDFIDNHTSATPSKPVRHRIYDSGSPDVEKMEELPSLNASDCSDSENEDVGHAKRELNAELSKLTPDATEKQIQDYAKQHHLVLLLQEDYAKLQYNDIDDVSDDRLKKATEIRGFVCLSQLEYNDLLEESEMRSKLEKKGFVTLPSQEYATISKAAESFAKPDFEYLANELNRIGFQAVETDYLEILKNNERLLSNPSESYLRSKCKEYQLLPLTNDEYKHLKKIEAAYEKPDKGYLTKKGNELGLILTTSGFYDDLLKRANEPSIEQLTEHGKKRGLYVLDEEKFFKLENPLLKNWLSKAETFNHVALKKEDYERLHKVAYEPTIEQLKSAAIKRLHRMLPLSEFDELREFRDTPTLAHLSKKAEIHDHTLISKKDLEIMKDSIDSPSIENIREKAVGHKVIEQDEYDSLLRKAQYPSLAQIQSHAEKFGLVTLEQEEYSNLYKNFHEPSLDFLKQKARDKAHMLVKAEEFERLTAIESQPEYWFLAQKAKVLGYLIIEASELSHLRNVAKHPALETMFAEATSRGYTLIEKERLASLIRSAERPTVDEIRSMAASRNLNVLSNDELNSLEETAKNPSTERISSVAKLRNLVLISKDDHETLKHNSKHPTLSIIEAEAHAFGRVVIPRDIYDRLNTDAHHPGIDLLKKHALLLDQVVLPKVEYSNLQKRISNPSIEELQLLASKLNFIMTPASDFQALQNTYENPSLDHLQKHTRRLNHVILTATDHESLVEKSNLPSLETIEKRAKELGHVLLDSTTFESLKNDSERPSLEKLRNHAAVHSCELVAQSDVSAMRTKLETPDLDFLNSHCERLNYKMLSVQEYIALEGAAKRPSMDIIRKRADMLDHIVLSKKEESTLRKTALEPDKETLLSHAEKAGLTFVDSIEYSRMKQSYEDPTIDRIEQYAHQRDHCLIKKHTLSDLKHQLEFPELEYLKLKAAALDHKLISLREFDEPSLEYIENKLSKHKKVAVHETEIDTLKMLAYEPSLEHIKSLPITKNQVILLTEKHTELVKKVDNLPKDVLIEKIEAHGLVAIPSSELESIKQKCNNPDAEWLQMVAEKNDLKFMSKQDFFTLLTLAHNPGIEHLRKLATNAHLTLIENDKFENLKQRAENPSVNDVKSMASKLDGEFIRNADLRSLKDLANCPDLNHISYHANRLGQVILTSSHYDNLLSPSMEQLTELAQKQRAIVISSDTYEDLNQMAHHPSVDHISKIALRHELRVVHKHVYEALEQQAQNPDINHVKACAASLDHSVIGKSDYMRLLELASRPDKEHVKKQAARLEMELISRGELALLKQRLNNPDIDFLKSNLSKHGYVAVPSQDFEKHLEDKEKLESMKLITFDEYNKLKSTYENPSASFLEDKANQQGNSIVGIDELKRLKSIYEEPSIQFLTEHSETKGFKVIEDKEYYQLRETFLSPSTEFISMKARNLGYRLMSEENYNEITMTINDPSVLFLEKKCASKELSIIPSNELKELRNKVENPGLEFLSEKATEQSYKLLPFEEHAKLLDAMNCPSLEYLKEKAKVHQLVVVQKDEYRKLEMDAVNPTRDSVEQKARSLGCVILEELEAMRMKDQLSDPPLEKLASDAAKKGHKVIPEHEYQSLSSHCEKSVQTLAKENGYHLLEAEEYRNLLEIANNPDIEKIQYQASLHGYAVVKDEDHRKLLSELDTPSLEYLRFKTRALKYRLVSEDDFEKLSEPLSTKLAKAGLTAVLKSEHHKLTNPSLDDLKQLSCLENFKVIADKEYHELTKPLEQQIQEAGLVALSNEEHRKLRLEAESPTLEVSRRVASKHGCVVIFEDEFHNLSKSIEERAAEAGKAVLEKDELEDLRKVIKEPTLDFITKSANSLGMTLVAKSELEAMHLAANKLLTDRANEENLILLSPKDRDDLMEFESKYRYATEALSEFKAKFENPSKDYLTKASKAKGLILVNSAEFENLNRSKNMSIHDKAAALSMTAIPTTEFEDLKNRANESIEEKAAQKGFNIIKVEDLKTLKYECEHPSLEKAKSVLQTNGLTSIGELDLEKLKKEATRSIDDKAIEAGFVLIHKIDHERTLQQLNSPTVDFIVSKANAMGFECIESSELDQLRAEASRSLSEVARSQGMVVIDSTELKALRDQLHRPDVESLRKAANDHGLIVLEMGEHENLKTKANRTIEEQLEGTQKMVIDTAKYDSLLLQATKPSMEALRKNATKKGMEIVPKDELDEMRSSCTEPLETKAEKQNLVLVHKDQFNDMNNQVTHPSKHYLIEKCAAMGLAVAEASTLKELSTDEGNVIISKDELEWLKSSAGRVLTIDEAKDVLSRHDMIVHDKDQHEKIINESSESKIPRVSELIQILEDKGYSVKKDIDEFEDASESFVLDEEELGQTARRLGFMLIKQTEYDDLVKYADSLNNEESLMKAGQELGYSVMSSNELLKLKQLLTEKDSRIHELSCEVESKVSRDQLRGEAANLGLVVLSDQEHKSLQERIAHLEASQPNVLTREELTERASDMGLSVIPTTELHSMKRTLMNLEDSLQIRQAAKKQGLLCVPISAYISSTPGDDPSDSQVTVLPTSQYEILRDSALESIAEEAFKDIAEKRGYKHTSEIPLIPKEPFNASLDSPLIESREVAAGGIPQSKSVGSNLTINSKASMLDSITGMSVASNISLTDKSMIPVITQVLIGEYLFKYYRKLGPLSSISATRHERYFWVHPYSLTLYWSTSNPVLKNPNVTKSKAIAILGVESVEDSNPIPVGLYHKSIIVHSQTKSVKFTCSNRRRHNIWYNSLRYLVHRNINELDFGGNTRHQVKNSEVDPSDEEEDGLADMTFDASNRQALPRSSTILRSKSFGRFMSLKK